MIFVQLAGKHVQTAYPVSPSGDLSIEPLKVVLIFGRWLNELPLAAATEALQREWVTLHYKKCHLIAFGTVSGHRFPAASRSLPLVETRIIDLQPEPLGLVTTALVALSA